MRLRALLFRMALWVAVRALLTAHKLEWASPEGEVSTDTGLEIEAALEHAWAARDELTKSVPTDAGTKA